MSGHTPTVLSPGAESVIARFEADWRRGCRPDPGAVLAACPVSERGAVLRELVRAELELRLKAGEAVRAEEYLARFPELAADTGAVDALRDVENRCRPDRGGTSLRTVVADRLPELDPSTRPTDRDRSASAFEVRAAENPDGSTPSLPPTVGGPAGAPALGRFAVGPVAAGALVAGRYRLIRPIGEGGMGTVWSAEQTEPVTRRVAVKLVRADHASSARIVARFGAERQAIALMDHPHIAKLLDAGTTAHGEPFFVMELVNGVPLTEYCDAHRLTVADRLNLFVRICQAVQHAHLKGIIHRDLKPSNILVESRDEKPVPRVIDFGLAKAVTGVALSEHSLFTGFGSVMGTPLYMAPEQTEPDSADIDTRADVYALGAILFELLAGGTPLTRDAIKGAPMAEVLRRVRESEAPAPSSRIGSGAGTNVAADRRTEPAKLARYVRGELDWIVLKALAKERDRRYETAAGLARDVERFLTHEPVTAGPPGASYRLKKFVRRNRGPVVAAALLMGALVLGMAGTTFGLIRAERARAAEAQQRERAEENERRARAEADAKELALGAEKLQRERAEENERKATAAAAAEAAARGRAADVLDAMTSDATGDSLASQAELGPAQKAFLTNALTYYKEFAASTGGDEATRARVADAAARIGLIQARFRRNAEALAALRTAVADYEQLAADFPADPLYQQRVFRNANNLGLLLNELKDRDGAEAAFRKGLTVMRKLADAYPDRPEYRSNLAGAHHNYAGVERGPNGWARAEAEYRTALAINTKLIQEFPENRDYRRNLAGTYTNLGNLLAAQEKIDDALKVLRTALDIRDKLAEEFPDEYEGGRTAVLNTMGNLLLRMSRPADAQPYYERALRLHDKLAAQFPAVPNHRYAQALSSNNLGRALAAQRKWPEAEDRYQRALDIREKLARDAPNDPGPRAEVALSHYNLGNLFSETGRAERAEDAFLKAIAIQRELVGKYPAAVGYRQGLAYSYDALGRARSKAGNWSAALEPFTSAIEIQLKLVREFPHATEYRGDLKGTYTNRAGAYYRCQSFPEALRDWDLAIELDPKQNPPVMRANRTPSLAHTGRVADALAEVAELSGRPGWDPVVWSNFARVYAIACAEVPDRKGEYADRAMELFRRAIKEGWNADVVRLKTSTDFAPLRDRDDFKAILAELEKKGPPKLERAPPPREKE